jgi:hypothetical protein
VLNLFSLHSLLFDRNLKLANDRVNPQLKLVNNYADSLHELDQAKDIKCMMSLSFVHLFQLYLCLSDFFSRLAKATALQRAMDKANKDGEALKASYNPAKNMDKDMYGRCCYFSDSDSSATRRSLRTP